MGVSVFGSGFSVAKLEEWYDRCLPGFLFEAE
jgi:hypothetical protein